MSTIESFLSAAFTPSTAPIWGGTLIAALAAIIAAFGASWLTNRYNQRLFEQQRKHELTVLEIQRTDNAQSVAVIVVGEAIGIYADLVTADGNENFVDTSVNILKDINKKTDAYRSMLPQLGILGSGIAEHVIRFYAGVELLASSAQSVPPDNAPKRRIADMSLLEQTFAFEALFGAYILNLTGGNPALASVGTNVTQRPMTGKTTLRRPHCN